MALVQTSNRRTKSAAHPCAGVIDAEEDDNVVRPDDAATVPHRSRQTDQQQVEAAEVGYSLTQLADRSAAWSESHLLIGHSNTAARLTSQHNADMSS